MAQVLRVAISSRALFDLSVENKIYESEGVQKYREFQVQHEGEPLGPGTAFPLVKALLQLNSGGKRAEVVLISRNSADTSLRIVNSLNHHGLEIHKIALTGGTPVARYLNAFGVDLFLSKYRDDVEAATEAGVPAGWLYDIPSDLTAPVDQIKIAFDGDAVIFSDESQRVYDEQGLAGFLAHEKAKADIPLPEGPFARLVRLISSSQEEAGPNEARIRTALVTARNCPAHERVIRTMRRWNVRIDELFFLGDTPKEEILRQFGAHIFFDDQQKNCERAASVVPTAQVLTLRAASAPPRRPPAAAEAAPASATPSQQSLLSS